MPPCTWQVIRRAQITGIGQPLEAGASGEGSQAACVVARAYGRAGAWFKHARGRAARRRPGARRALFLLAPRTPVDLPRRVVLTAPSRPLGSAAAGAASAIVGTALYIVLSNLSTHIEKVSKALASSAYRSPSHHYSTRILVSYIPASLLSPSAIAITDYPQPYSSHAQCARASRAPPPSSPASSLRSPCCCRAACAPSDCRG